MNMLLELSTSLGQALQAKHWQLALAESCTGGMVAQAVTAIAGSSGWFDRGFVTYSNAAKTEMLGVPAALIAEFGAVSEPVAEAMALGVLQYSQAHLSAAITGIAGPGGGSLHKPVGTVCFAWASRGDGDSGNTTVIETRHFEGDRTQVREQAASYLLAGLLKIANAL
ncbi:CinA family protein [Methylophilus sp. OH31]|uniref:CinA family protein n=1 Tax=Methylophilus sp. OH31 TaxID=1387312 RepID=UPI0004655B67|nr:CinA family protein [Methylophilus sp. OH31]